MNAHTNIKRLSRDDYATCAEYRDRLKAIHAEAFATLCASEAGERALDILHGDLANVIQQLEGDMDDIPRPDTDTADPYRLADSHGYQRRAL